MLQHVKLKIDLLREQHVSLAANHKTVRLGTVRERVIKLVFVPVVQMERVMAG